MRVIWTIFIYFSSTVFSNDTVDREDRRPNIIYILTDDLGWADVTWNNRKVKSTPFLYSMSQNGTVLTQEGMNFKHCKEKNKKTF